jgi:hypothetical protein
MYRLGNMYRAVNVISARPRPDFFGFSAGCVSRVAGMGIAEGLPGSGIRYALLGDRVSQSLGDL